MREKIIELIQESGRGYVEKTKTIRTTCPLCNREDKFSILKENGACICYRGSCEFGKRWFDSWVSLTFNVPMKRARELIRSGSDNVDKLVAPSSLSFNINEDGPDTSLTEVVFPEFHMTSLLDQAAIEGLTYLERRGITKEMVSKYEIYFSRLERRVYFPIKMNGKFYGYQGRAIDKVDDSFKVRNNEGFSRESLVMFADNLGGSDFAIVAEGPVDAMKFDLVGSNVCTMGKVVTDKQLAVISDYGVEKLYLALDDDAAYEMNQIVAKTHLKAFRLRVPESCVVRCKSLGVKSDFGECTQEEAKQAFDNAQPLDSSIVMFHVPSEVK